MSNDSDDSLGLTEEEDKSELISARGSAWHKVPKEVQPKTLQ